MARPTPLDPDFAQRVRDSFGRQPFMRTIGAELTDVAPGRCTIELPFREDLCQQHGFLHAGVTGTLADNAAGYAAYSLMPADSSVLTIEFKMNLLAPAVGERLIARAEVKRSGKTITVVQAEVSAVKDGHEKPVAMMQATMMCLHNAPDRP